MQNSTKSEDDREVVRKYAATSFPELLSASAHSGAMLYYLDNWLSSSAKADFGRADFERVAIESMHLWNNTNVIVDTGSTGDQDGLGFLHRIQLEHHACSLPEVRARNQDDQHEDGGNNDLIGRDGHDIGHEDDAVETNQKAKWVQEFSDAEYS